MENFPQKYSQFRMKFGRSILRNQPAESYTDRKGNLGGFT